MEPRGIELINRYKRNYSIPDVAEVTEQMILTHWELEKKLTNDLLESNSENRWEVFEQAYTNLYSKLEWLNSLSEDRTSPADKFATWIQIIGSPPQKIYEVGSGKAEMITYLAKCGFECKATEITKERGSKHTNPSLPCLSWGNSDGVHLDHFEPTEFYDLVISNQVIEHFHPDDLVISNQVIEHFHPDDLIIHFQSAYKIITKQGRYIFTTPHCHTGPHDLSLVFKYDEPQCMHLKEYTYRELCDALKMAGYQHVCCAVPANLKKIVSRLGITKEGQMTAIGTFYLNMMLILENILFAIPYKKLRRFFSKLLRKAYLFADNIFLIAYK